MTKTMISAIILNREIVRVPKTAGKCKILPREIICCIMNPNAMEWLGFFVLLSKGNEGKMSKGNIRKKANRNYRQQKPKADISEDSRKKIVEQIQISEAISDLKYQLFQTRLRNLSKRLALIFFMVLIIVLAGFMLFWPICYFINDSELTNIISTIVQCLMGTVSLVVGIWGLILAKRSDRKSNQSSSLIDTLPAMRNPDPIPTETDVDRSKL